MLHKTDIMLIGRSRDALSGISGLLEGQRAFSLRSHVYGNGQSELWGKDDQDPMPHALALCVDEDWRASLQGMLEALPQERPPFLVFSPSSDIELLRTAMRGGARDVLSPPYDREELCTRLLELAQEEQAHTKRHSARMIAFINAKGGSGASFLAVNVASALANRHKRKSLLMDLDLQFGSVPVYLNMSPSDGLIKALEFVETLDSAALSGYIKKHDNGLHLLTTTTNRLVLPDEIAEERVVKLLDVLESSYQDIVVDLPRRIDRLTAAIIERLDMVVVVSQQSVGHLQDTRRLMSILREHLGVTDNRILLALNRFSRKAEVRREDFSNAFPGLKVVTVPSDYAAVSESINLGSPVVTGVSHTPLVKAIHTLTSQVMPQQQELQPHNRGLLGWLGLSARQ